MKWRESLSKQAESLTNVAAASQQSLEQQINEFITLSKKIASNGGMHFFTGVGKNGHVAAKISSTYNSLGIRSSFVDPVNTLHGDMGIFSAKDVLLAFSKSGETDELLTFVRKLRVQGFKNIVSVTSSKDSTLASLARHNIVIPVKYEGDHIGNIVPLASTIIYEAVMQSAAIEISSESGFTKSDFVARHPGGAIGKLRRRNK
jgi:arabinose-5-phosphate isomerase